jgi:hypothetical protein
MTTTLILCLTLVLVGIALTRREFQKLAYVKR